MNTKKLYLTRDKSVEMDYCLWTKKPDGMNNNGYWNMGSVHPSTMLFSMGAEEFENDYHIVLKPGEIAEVTMKVNVICQK